MKEYREIQLKGTATPSYIREESIKALGKVNAFVFDCDGVLLDTRESYDVCIKKTSESIIEALTGKKVSINEDYIYRLRDTGGFNNDWNIVYALIQFYISELSEDRVLDLTAIYLKALEKPVFERYNCIENQTRTDTPGVFIPDSFDNFAGSLDSTGISSVDVFLSGVNGEFSSLVKQVLEYPGDVQKSPITRLFEEYFLGSQLFNEVYRVAPLFVENPIGLIEKERVVITSDTLNAFTQLSKNSLGVASGSSRAAAEHILGDVLDYFRQEAVVWMDDVDAEMSQTGRTGLHKPSPYSLNRAAKNLEPYDMILYAGDTQADQTMASQSERKILFAGVTSYTGQSEKARIGFMNRGADIVTSSVNEIPVILKNLRGEMI